LAQETFLRILSLTKRELLGGFCQWDEAQGFFFEEQTGSGETEKEDVCRGVDTYGLDFWPKERIDKKLESDKVSKTREGSRKRNKE
jgi:hypothetical protein